MTYAAPQPALLLAKFSIKIKTLPCSPFPTPIQISASPCLSSPKQRDCGALRCTEKDSAHNLFDDFSALTSDIPWDADTTWSTFSAYFFILHIPLSVGGLSIAAHILHRSVLDPLTMAGSALVLQMTEAIGAVALFNYAAKQEFTFSTFIPGTLNSEKRNWLTASALGIGFLIGLVLLTSSVIDRVVGPKDVNNPILKDILLYGPASRTACFFLYCLVSPLLEEVVYRGFLLNSLASKSKWWQAVIISSCVFSIAHFSGENSIQLFFIGCVLGSAYCWTGNLAAPFTIHSVYNAMTLLATVVSQR